jgi:hypothetical protein
LQAALDLPEIADIAIPGITAPKTLQSLLAAGIGNSVEIEFGSEHLSRAQTGARSLRKWIAGGHELMLQGFQPYRSKESAWARARIGNSIATFHYRAIGITTPNHLRSMGIDPALSQGVRSETGLLASPARRHFWSPYSASKRRCISIGHETPELEPSTAPIHPVDQEIIWKPEQGLCDA